MKNYNRIIIFANGFLHPSFLDDKKKDDYVVAVDGGARWLLNQGEVPDIAIGDFDSVTNSQLERIKKSVSEVKIFSATKDETDLELALDHALCFKPKEIMIYGGIGSRFDHTLGALQLLEKPLRMNIPTVIKDKTNQIQLLKDNVVIRKSDMFRYLSILPYSEEILVSIEGCLYNLQNQLIRRSSTIGISNEISKIARIWIHKGIAVLIQSRDG